jgi:hypothetical protein
MNILYSNKGSPPQAVHSQGGSIIMGIGVPKLAYENLDLGIENRYYLKVSSMMSFFDFQIGLLQITLQKILILIFTTATLLQPE